jgi:glutamyl-tRNA synthetase
LADPRLYDADAVAKHLSQPGTQDLIATLHDVFANAAFDESSLEGKLRQVATERGIKAGTLIHATRIAMTGRMISPGLFEMLVLLGRDRVLARLENLNRWLEASSRTAGN